MKKILPIALLLMVHSLLLIQEITLTQVLCHRNDGSTMLELARFDYQCYCQPDHQHDDPAHEHALEPESDREHRQAGQNVLKNQCCFCFDLPVNQNRHIRDINPDFDSYTEISTTIDINQNQPNALSIALGELYEKIPLTKFLTRGSPPIGHTVLRC